VFLSGAFVKSLMLFVAPAEARVQDELQSPPSFQVTETLIGTFEFSNGAQTLTLSSNAARTSVGTLLA